MINLSEIYLLAKSLKYSEFEQEIKSKLTGQPSTVVIDCKIGILDLRKVDSLVYLYHSSDWEYGNDEKRCTELIEITRNKIGYTAKDVL